MPVDFIANDEVGNIPRDRAGYSDNSGFLHVKMIVFKREHFAAVCAGCGVLTQYPKTRPRES